MQNHYRIGVRSAFAVSAILCLSLLVCGCGYHFQGARTGLPADIHSIAIPMFANRTLQTGVEAEVTRALTARFTSAAQLAVTDRASADALLSGMVKSIENYPIGISGGTIQSATQYRFTIVVEMTLMQPSTGKVLWKGQLSEYRIYNVDPSLAATENNKQEAIRQISTLLAESIYSVMLDKF